MCMWYVYSVAMTTTETTPRWAVLNDESVKAIAEFGDLNPGQVRGIEMLVLLAVGKVSISA